MAGLPAECLEADPSKILLENPAHGWHVSRRSGPPASPGVVASDGGAGGQNVIFTSSGTPMGRSTGSSDTNTPSTKCALKWRVIAKAYRERKYPSDNYGPIFLNAS